MYLTKILKKLFPLTLSCFVWAQMVNAGLNASFTDGQELPPATATCPYNQVCTGDVVLITMHTDLSPWNRTLVRTSISVAKDAYDLNKGYLPVRTDGPSFHGFYYRVKPGKTYYFKAIYIYKDIADGHTGRFTHYLYYKSRGDALNPEGSGLEGAISPDKAKAMGLPPIPECWSAKSPAHFCTNQVVHIFWNNNRGKHKSVLDIDLYVNGQHIKHSNGPEYRGHFQDFYYTFPDLAYFGVPVSFEVTWTVRSYRKPWTSHYESSQPLVNQYTPEWAHECKPDDSWEKCQYHWKD